MKQAKKDRRFSVTSLRVLTVALVVTLFTVTLTYTTAWASYQKQLEAQTAHPVFSVIDAESFDGGRFTAEDVHASRLTAFNVWETTCSACLVEMPDLEELTKGYDRADFQLVGICADLYDEHTGELRPEMVEKAKGLMATAGTYFPNLIPDKDLNTYLRASAVAYPTTFVVDSEGRLLDVTCGTKTLEGWRAYVDEQLEGLQ